MQGARKVTAAYGASASGALAFSFPYQGLQGLCDRALDSL